MNLKLLICGFFLLPLSLLAAPSSSLFARVNDTEIQAAEFEEAVQQGYRRKFYHAKPQEAEVENYLQESAWELIDRTLFLDEITRRNIKPDDKVVADKLSAWERRYNLSPNWAATRAVELPKLKAKHELDSQVERLQAIVKRPPVFSPAQVRHFFDTRPELFTEPDQARLSLILLNVDPSSPEADWQAMIVEADAIRERLLKGEDFAALAVKRSADESAENGGDMGFVHRGQVDLGIQNGVDAAKAGDVLKPVRTLRGIAVVRVEEKRLPRPALYDLAAPRAEALMQREASEQQWKKFVAETRRQAKVEFGESFKRFSAGIDTIK